MSGIVQATLNKVKSNIKNVYNRRIAAVFALSQAFAGYVIQDFRARQASGEVGEFWENQTYDAVNKAFARAFQEKNIVGFRFSHGVKYGVYLELANDRRHEALRPLIVKFSKPFRKALQKLYKG